jgi:hypothetical protein
MSSITGYRTVRLSSSHLRRNNSEPHAATSVRIDFEAFTKPTYSDTYDIIKREN